MTYRLPICTSMNRSPAISGYRLSLIQNPMPNIVCIHFAFIFLIFFISTRRRKNCVCSNVKFYCFSSGKNLIYCIDLQVSFRLEHFTWKYRSISLNVNEMLCFIGQTILLLDQILSCRLFKGNKINEFTKSC